MTHQNNSITLLILESAAEWPTWGTGIRMQAPNSIVEVQLETESSSEFTSRVLERIRVLKEKDAPIQAAGYACSADVSEKQTADRIAICSALLKSIQAGQDVDLQEQASPTSWRSSRPPQPELVLGGGSWGQLGSEGDARRALMELWGELSTLSTEMSGAPVRVCFEESTPDSSGVYAVEDGVTMAGIDSSLGPESGLSPDSMQGSDLSLSADAVLRSSQVAGEPLDQASDT
ncbi:MAG: hypothetical protein MK135_01720, partial [Polyangiaceae bacterium]|nr:hypothetical protein [Polyangiaceae bacterium]